MVSRCCFTEVFLVHCETDHYKCTCCDQACDLSEGKGKDENGHQLGNDHT